MASWITWKEYSQQILNNITAITYPPTIKYITDLFIDYTALQEIHYSPNTILFEPLFQDCSLRYLDIYNEKLLKTDYLFTIHKRETYWTDGLCRDERYVTKVCTSLEYLVSFIENPSPLSFYRDFVREGYWEKETVWVDAFEFHYCLFGKDLSEIDLYVPEESIELYRITADWNKFRNILPMTDEMKNSYERAWNEAMTVKTPEGKDACVERWYSINGHRLSSPRKGINIGVMSDGSTRKVIGK